MTENTKTHDHLNGCKKWHLIKIQHPFMIKSLTKVGKQVTFLNIIQDTYDRSTTNIILNGERLKAFLLKSGTRQGSPVHFSLSVVSDSVTP